LHGGDCNVAERTGPYHEVLAVDGQTLELFVEDVPIAVELQRRSS
jgi:hypothetical protein